MLLHVSGPELTFNDLTMLDDLFLSRGYPRLACRLRRCSRRLTSSYCLVLRMHIRDTLITNTKLRIHGSEIVTGDLQRTGCAAGMQSELVE